MILVFRVWAVAVVAVVIRVFVTDIELVEDNAKNLATNVADLFGGAADFVAQGFGVILNELDTNDKSSYYHSYYGYGPDPKDSTKADRASKTDKAS